jgi:hypothetical protein
LKGFEVSVEFIATKDMRLFSGSFSFYNTGDGLGFDLAVRARRLEIIKFVTVFFSVGEFCAIAYIEIRIMY